MSPGAHCRDVGRRLKLFAVDRLVPLVSSRRSMPLPPMSSPFGSLWRVRQRCPVPSRSRASRSHLAWHCPCIHRLVDMAEAEREEIETDFVRTKVKATQRSIDEPTSIDIGMPDLDVDLLDGRQLRRSPGVTFIYPAFSLHVCQRGLPHTALMRKRTTMLKNRRIAAQVPPQMLRRRVLWQSGSMNCRKTRLWPASLLVWRR
jgi:hypothetical protein